MPKKFSPEPPEVLISFRDLVAEDWAVVSGIYQQGLNTGHATFETKVPDWKQWDLSHLEHSRLLVLYNSEIAGWAALSPVSGRCVYGGVAEVSIYLGQEFSGRRLGTYLLQQLIRNSEENGIWTLQASMFPENIASRKLHKKCGFREIGYRERIGKRDNTWFDNIIMERRSSKVGVE